MVVSKPMLGTGPVGRYVAALAACSLALAACGGSGKSTGSATPKRGDCVDTSSSGGGHVVACGSAHAKSTLVDNGELPSKAIACVTIDSGTQSDFSVTVAGKVYCARPKGSGATTASQTPTTGATTTGTAATIPPSFVRSLDRIQGPYKKWAADVGAELQHGGSQSDTTLSARLRALASRGVALSGELEHLLPAPGPAAPAFQQLLEGTNQAVSSLERTAAAAATHNTAAARRAVGDLNGGFARAAAGINGLKRAGIR